MVNSKKKGSRGELECSKFLSKWFKCRRGQQYQGSPDSPDIVFENKKIHKLLHPEVKRTERLNIEKAWQQAAADAPATAWPVVFHRKNKTRWKVIIDAEDFMELFYQWFIETGDSNEIEKL